MAAPATHTFGPGAATSSELNSFVVTPLAFTLAKPFAKVKRAAVQSIPNASFTTVTFDNEIYDYGTMYDAGSPTRLTAREAGWYTAVGHVGFIANATGIRGIGFQVNGVSTDGGMIFVGAFASLDARMGVVEHLFFNVGDYIEIIIYQSSGGALNTSAAAGSVPTLSLMWERN
jgi:hypothetical protein